MQQTDWVEFAAAHAEAERHHADDMFQQALAAAITKGLEHPPMIGIDKRPCTKRPIFVSQRAS